MNLNEFATSLGYSSREREDGAVSWYDQEDNRMSEGLSSLQDSFNDFNRFDSQGRPIYGTSAVLPGKAGSSFQDESGQTRYRFGSDSLTDQLRSVGAQGTDLQYDPMYGYHIPQKLQDEWSGAFQKPSMMENLMSNSPLLLAGLASGAMLGGAFGTMGGAEGLAGIEGLAGMEGFAPVNFEGLANAATGLNQTIPSSWMEMLSGNASSGGSGMFNDVFSFASQNSGGVDFANSASQLQNPFTSVNPFEGFTTGINDAFNTGNGLASSISPNTLGSSPLGAGINGAVSGASSGGDFFSQFKDFLTKPQIPGLNNSTGANGAAALINYLIKSQQAGSLNSAANQSAQLNNPMNQPQRIPFQAAYLDLMSNPDSYKHTPYAVGQTNLANQAFQNNVSKYGPSGTAFDQYLKNFQNIQSNDFFKLADQYSTAGAFNQGNGGAGNSFAQLAGPAAAAQNSAFEGFGKLLSDAQPQPTYQPQNVIQNPISGATTIKV